MLKLMEQKLGSLKEFECSAKHLNTSMRNIIDKCLLSRNKPTFVIGTRQKMIDHGLTDCVLKWHVSDEIFMLDHMVC